MSDYLAIVDLGGQYCHLISRRLRGLGVRSTIFGPEAGAAELAGARGVILSGGPLSVYAADAKSVDREFLNLGIPILGICYGHQYLAHILGGRVERGTGEFGKSHLSLSESDSIFDGLPTKQTVWMSHSDSVVAIPKGGITLGSTDSCDNAAFALLEKRIFGLQFHPEVVHTEYGTGILENFAKKICGIQTELHEADLVTEMLEAIRQRVGTRSVFFLVSGGVDSTVAFSLCARALPEGRVLGLYVDTGLMRMGEREELERNLESVGLLHRLKVRDESRCFLAALTGVTDPEKKREIIGRLFVQVQGEAMRDFGISPECWLLGQGTIYPDTIESGGDMGRAAVIKTHHNRCAEILELIASGRVIEPLAELYKDEVRQLGKLLGLDARLTNRWPFPGPGLAIRCLCSAREATFGERVNLPSDFSNYRGYQFPISSVGVQGDDRTYRDIAAIESNGVLNYEELERISTELCNLGSAHNRVVYLLGTGRSLSLSEAQVVPTEITADRLALLRKADHIVRTELAKEGETDSVWQFPVVLLPLRFEKGESIVFRPVNSEDGMTANFARLPPRTIARITEEILRLDDVDAVLLDVTDKPPATIEWE